jgi:hypothetical protein
MLHCGLYSVPNTTLTHVPLDPISDHLYPNDLPVYPEHSACNESFTVVNASHANDLHNK